MEVALAAANRCDCEKCTAEGPITRIVEGLRHRIVFRAFGLVECYRPIGQGTRRKATRFRLTAAGELVPEDRGDRRRAALDEWGYLLEVHAGFRRERLGGYRRVAAASRRGPARGGGVDTHMATWLVEELRRRGDTAQQAAERTAELLSFSAATVLRHYRTGSKPPPPCSRNALLGPVFARTLIGALGLADRLSQFPQAGWLRLLADEMAAQAMEGLALAASPCAGEYGPARRAAVLCDAKRCSDHFTEGLDAYAQAVRGPAATHPG